MVIDKDKSGCCNTDVSCFSYQLIWTVYARVHKGDNMSGDLSNVQFARIINGSLVYDEGKDDDFVFEGTYSYMCIY